jgi:hypothetical protein
MDENKTNTYMLLVCGVGSPIAACPSSGYTLHATMMNMHVQCGRIHTCDRGYNRACSHMLDPQACMLCMYVVNLGKKAPGCMLMHMHTPAAGKGLPPSLILPSYTITWSFTGDGESTICNVKWVNACVLVHMHHPPTYLLCTSVQ